MVQLEHIMVGVILTSAICIIAFFVCRVFQTKINKNLLSILDDILKAWKKYNDATEILESSIAESYLNLAKGIDEIKENASDGKSLLVLISGKDDKCNNHCKKEVRGDTVQRTKTDRPRRKYARRNNAA